MLRTLCLLSAALVLYAASPDHVSRIESGLRPPVKSTTENSTARWTIHDRMAHYKVPAVSVAVINNGKVEWAKAYGILDATTKEPVNTETLFQAASISKPVSGIAALRLVAEGKLTLDADVNAKLKSWQVPSHTFGKPVTLRGLLSHTAGTTVHGFPGYKAGTTVPSAVQVLIGEPPANTSKVVVDIEPGTKFRYSGGGFTVMQVLMSDVTGQRFADLMQQSVLGPLGMTRSTFEQPLPDRLAANAARAHGRNGQPIDGRWHTYPEQAAAGLWTTPTDLAKVLLAIQRASSGETKLLPIAITREMLTAGQGEYGLSWGISKTDGKPGFGHGGSNAGFRCTAWAYAAKGQGGAVIMTNGDNGGPLAGEILRSISAEYGWPDHK